MTETPNLPAVPDPERLPVPKDTSYEVELDPAPTTAEVVPVDPPPPAAGELLPVIPGHLRTRAGVQATLVRYGGRQWHRARYHGIRSPQYLLAAVCYAVAGLFRLVARQVRWWWLTEQHGLRKSAAGGRDSKEWLALHKEAKETRRFRGRVLAVEAAGLGLGLGLMIAYAAWWWWVILAAVALPVLARAGKPADKRIIHPAMVVPRFRTLTADVVLRAYYAAGLGHPDKPGMQVTFGSTMARDGEGSRVLVDLPHGLGLKDAINAKDKVASGLDVQTSQVFLHRDPTSYRRHALWVADRDPLAVPVGRTPLLACRATDIWKPAPLGLDERGQLVTLLLMWASVLVGALPRQGKTFTARLLALFAALDPFVQIDVFDAAGKPDWRKFALVADCCAFGLTPTREGLPPEILLARLEWLKAEVQDRYHRLSALPAAICPEGKLTRQIARDPDLGMPVRLLVLDEFQEYYDLGKISNDIAELLRFLVKVAPAAGVIPLWATQKPSGIGGTGNLSQMFNATRDNFVVRFALRTASYSVSEAVLGQGTYGMGLDSSALLPQYKGVGILYGATDASPTVRTHLADAQDAEKILVAARGLRERAGTLSGMAADEEFTQPARDVLGDVLAVFAGDSGLQWPVLAARLAAQLPERWKDATGDSVSAECRALGVPSVDVKAFGRALKGCRRADVERVAAS